MSIPQRARLEAMESLWMSRYNDSGKETPTVQSTIMNRRSAKSERTGTEGRLGKMERTTCGIVSPARE